MTGERGSESEGSLFGDRIIESTIGVERRGGLIGDGIGSESSSVMSTVRLARNETYESAFSWPDVDEYRDYPRDWYMCEKRGGGVGTKLMEQIY